MTHTISQDHLMPLPRAAAAMPKYLNPLMRPLARYVPPLAVIHHRGRTSGNSYDSPVQAYRTPDGVLVGLAYSDKPNWARNLLAAGDGETTRMGKTYTISNPRLRDSDATALLPAPIALMMTSLGITGFLQFDVAPQ